MIFKNTRVGIFFCPHAGNSPRLYPLSFRKEFNSSAIVTFEGRRCKAYYNTTDDWDTSGLEWFEDRLLAQPSTVHLQCPYEYRKPFLHVHKDTITAYTALFENSRNYGQNEIMTWLEMNAAGWYEYYLPWAEPNRVWFEDHNDALAFKMRFAR